MRQSRSSTAPILLLMFLSLAGWANAYVQSRFASDWHRLALKAIATAELCANQKERKLVEDPGSVMVMFSWGGRVFLMSRLPNDPPRVYVPDWEAIKMQHRQSMYCEGGPTPVKAPQNREFARLTPDHGDCPIYLEVK